MTLSPAVTQRVAQQIVTLETFGPEHGLKMLAAHMEPSFVKHRLFPSIYPFAEDDVAALCRSANSPRTFLQSARTAFEAWLDEEDSLAVWAVPDVPLVVTRESVDGLIRTTMQKFERGHLDTYDREIPIEQDFFGRTKNIVETILACSGEKAMYDRATCGTKAMPPNLIVRTPGGGESLCVCINNAEGNSFTSRMRNLAEVMKSADGPRRAILLRDRRCKAAGSKGQDYVESFQEMGGVYLPSGGNEVSLLNALYDTLVAIEEHDLSIGKHEIDKKQFVEFLKCDGAGRKSQMLRSAAALSDAFARAVGVDRPESNPTVPLQAPPLPLQAPTKDGPKPTKVAVKKPKANPNAAAKPSQKLNPTSPVTKAKSVESAPIVPVRVVVGDTELDSPSLGLIGRLRDGNQGLAISFSKPQCMILLGYMGSGKSYALGVLIENALKTYPHLSRHQKPMCVVAFNYSKNPEARFEYSGYQDSNTKPVEVRRLRTEYGAEPSGIDRVNVFGFGPELRRRQGEYRGVPLYPIQFRPDELGAEHWEILMKPPSPQAEYMDVIRDIIQKLFYQERLTYKNLEKHILTDERLSNMQRRKAKNRLSFASKWLTDDRNYEWGEVLTSGSLNVFDLRMQALSSDDALKLCLETIPKQGLRFGSVWFLMVGHPTGVYRHVRSDESQEAPTRHHLDLARGPLGHHRVAARRGVSHQSDGASSGRSSAGH